MSAPPVNVGSITATASVSMDPDRSGMFICSGAGDDVEIQAALIYVNALGAGSIYFETGDYDITQKLSIPDGLSDLHLIGSNLGATLTLANNVNDHLLAYEESTDIYWIDIKHLQFQGNQANQTGGCCIYLNDHVKDTLVFDCFISDAEDDCLQFLSLWNARVVSCTIEHAGRFGIHAAAGTDLKVVNSSFKFNWVGLNLASYHGSVVNNFFYQSERYGLQVGADKNTVTSNTFLDNSQESVGGFPDIYNTGDGNLYSFNILDGNNQSSLGIQISSGSDNRVQKNQYSNHTVSRVSDAGTDTRFDTHSIQFSSGGNAAGIQIAQFIHADASPKGWEIDADAEWAIALDQLPDDVQEVLRIIIWAVGLAAPGAGNNMRLELLANAGRSDEPFNTEPISVVNRNNQEEAFAINDVISWVFSRFLDADILDLTGGDSIEIKVKHEAAGNGDIATDAVFRCVEIEYV